jgi:signal transduction histidine kinase
LFTPGTWTFNRTWQGRALIFLSLFTIGLGALGIYTLHTAPALGFSSGFWFSLSELEIRRIDELELDPTLSLSLPEFASVEAESRWWRAQEQLFEHLHIRSSVHVTVVDASGRLHTEPARIGSLPFFNILRRTWLIYFTAVVYLGSALSVFRRHRSLAGSILTFFLLACALYFISAAPVVARALALPPSLFKFFIGVLYAAAASLTTLVHFALVFPVPKQLVLRQRWIPYLPYATTVLVVTLYLSGITAFGATFPVLITGVLIVISAFLHSLLQERDPFLRRQIRLSLTAPVLVSLFFICCYVTPGVFRLAPIDFRYVALCFLILPFALPLAMDNLALYGARLEVERVALQEKEHIRADLHDLILNNLAVISRTSEVARTQLHGAPIGVARRLHSIQELASGTSRQLREFLWVLDDQHNNWEELCGRLRQRGHEFLEDAGCEFELDVVPAVFALPFPPLRLRVCFDRVYKEALLNVVKHARAKQVHVSLFCRDAMLICAVEDDGAGFDVNAKLNGGHYGLDNMQRRVGEVGGRVIFFSEAGLGTRLTVELPLT